MADGIEIRAIVAGDLPAFYTHQADPEAHRMAAFPPRDREAFDAHWTEVLADETVVTRTVLVGGRVAGHVLAFDLEDERVIGYWIGREFWGRGVATAALMAFLREVRTRPLRAHVAKTNVGSIRVLEKCGFVPERETRGAIRGEEVDEVVLRLD